MQTQAPQVIDNTTSSIPKSHAIAQPPTPACNPTQVAILTLEPEPNLNIIPTFQPHNINFPKLQSHVQEAKDSHLNQEPIPLSLATAPTFIWRSKTTSKGSLPAKNYTNKGTNKVIHTESTPITKQGYWTCWLVEDLWFALGMANTSPTQKCLGVSPFLWRTNNLIKSGTWST